jgi:protein-disulfide isomerase
MSGITRHSPESQLIAGHTPPALDSVPNWKELSSSGIVGMPLDAPVRVTVFSSYLCAACAATSAALDRLQVEMNDRLAVTWRHVSFVSSALADSATSAADCASA